MKIFNPCCPSFVIQNMTLLASSGHVMMVTGPLMLQCLHVTVYEAATGSPLTTSLTFTPQTLQGYIKYFIFIFLIIVFNQYPVECQ